MADTRERDIIHSLISLSDRLVDDFDVLDLTIELTETCARLLDVAAAGILLADAGGALHLLAATSEQAAKLEVFQLQREEGPCLDCYHTGAPVSVPDLGAEAERWPRFTSAAAQQGFDSVHALPLRLRQDVLGALGLFGTARGSLNENDLLLAQALAHIGSMAIVHQNADLSRANVLPVVHAAVASRGLVEIAKGMVAEVQKVDMDEAFRRLRRHAAHSNQRLADLARTLVTGTYESRADTLRGVATSAESDSASRSRAGETGNH